jgi:uncharacterized protein YdeI (BOF family)
VKSLKARSGKNWIIVALLAAPMAIGFATGCGDFWQAPNGGSTGTTASTTTISASTTTPVEGTAITLTATVSPSTATGTVTFYNGTSSLATETLTDGTATDSVTFTTVGTASVTATYNGSSVYETSTSSPVSVTVSATAAFVPTTTTLDASDTEPSAGDRVILTAKVDPAESTGRVAFYDATASPSLSTPLGTATVNLGTATLAAAFTNTGTHRIIAIYGGSSSYANSSTLRALDIKIDR